MRILVLLIALALAATVNLAFWYLPNRPMPLPDVWAGGPLKSASFAPYRRGQSPLEEKFPTQEQIEADMAALQGLFNGVRTYSSLEGLEIVAQKGPQYGLDVTYGAWISANKRNNEAEIAALIAAANKYPNSIKRVIVGNEVLLRQEQTAAELAVHLRRVRAAIKQPVTYADVWEFWLRNPELAREVDFITVHFLPYWEDEPVGVEHAMEHILAVYEKVKKAFPGKPILIGEVGWPSHGRDREGARVGRYQEANFLNAFANLAAKHGMDYNIVEAFDQTWKSALEGTMGGNWGVLDSRRQPKFPLAGPVVENPDWPIAFAASTALTVGIAALLIARTTLSGGPLLGLVLLAQAFATMLALCGQAGFKLWWDKGVLAWPLGMLALQAALAALLLHEAWRRLEREKYRPPFRSAAMSLADFSDHWALYLPLGRSTVSITKIERFRLRWRRWLIEWLMLLAILLGLYETVWLAIRPDLAQFRPTLEQAPDLVRYWLHVIFNGRYRDFPIAFFLVPAVGWPLWRLALALLDRTGWMEAPEERQTLRLEWLAVVLMLAGAAGMLWVERFLNREAWLWAGVSLLLLAPFIERLVANRIAK